MIDPFQQAKETSDYLRKRSKIQHERSIKYGSSREDKERYLAHKRDHYQQECGRLLYRLFFVWGFDPLAWRWISADAPGLRTENRTAVLMNYREFVTSHIYLSLLQNAWETAENFGLDRVDTTFRMCFILRRVLPGATYCWILRNPDLPDELRNTTKAALAGWCDEQCNRKNQRLFKALKSEMNVTPDSLLREITTAVFATEPDMTAGMKKFLTDIFQEVEGRGRSKLEAAWTVIEETGELVDFADPADALKTFFEREDLRELMNEAKLGPQERQLIEQMIENPELAGYGGNVELARIVGRSTAQIGVEKSRAFKKLQEANENRRS